MPSDDSTRLKEPYLLCLGDSAVVVKTPSSPCFVGFANLEVAKRFITQNFPSEKQCGSTSIPALAKTWSEESRAVPIIFFQRSEEVDAFIVDPQHFEYAKHQRTFSELAKNG